MGNSTDPDPWKAAGDENRKDRLAPRSGAAARHRLSTPPHPQAPMSASFQPPLAFAINGLGRIGRALVRIALEQPDLQLVAANDIAPPDQLAPLLRRDTLHGPLGSEISASATELTIQGRSVRCFAEAEPGRIPWQETEAQVVVDATGRCLSRECAQAHRRGGVAKVLVSANAAELDATLCYGINHDDYEPARHHLLSAASCTTNCLAPVAMLLDREFGIERGMLNTVHSYNNDQRLLESPHRDPRRARAAALNMIPTTTSAVEAIERVLPTLTGRLAGLAVRVPTPNVSLIDLMVELRREPTVHDLRACFTQEASGSLQGILAVTEEPVVSSDFLGDPHSAIVDLSLFQQVGGSLYRIVAWYDNEWGHAARLADLLTFLAKKGL